MCRHCAAAQVVAVREATRNDDKVQAGEISLLVPDHARFGTGSTQRDRHVTLAVDTGEDDDAGFHLCPSPQGKKRTMAWPMAGGAGPSSCVSTYAVTTSASRSGVKSEGGQTPRGGLGANCRS